MSTTAEREQGFRGLRGFTIVELFAVLAILALVGFFFLPVWLGSQAESRNARCREQLGQIGRAVNLHAGDHNDRLPGCQHEPPSWVEGLSAYTSRANFICPEESIVSDASKPRKWTYALNDFLTPHPYGARELDYSKLNRMPSPGQTLAFGEEAVEFRIYDHFHFADARENGFPLDAFAEQVDARRHSGTANYLFVDGHVEVLAWNSGAKPKLTYPNSKFVHPAGSSARPALARR